MIPKGESSMEVLNSIPVFVRDFGIFATMVIFSLYLLRFSPFAFKVEGTYTFLIGRNGTLAQIAQVADHDHDDH